VDAKEFELVVGVDASPALIGGRPIVTAQQLPNAPNFYHTPPIELVAPGDPRLSIGTLPREQVHYMAVKPGHAIHLVLANPGDLVMQQAVATAEVTEEVESLWIKALKRAAHCAGMDRDDPNWGALSAQTIETISERMYSQVAFKLQAKFMSPLTQFIQLAYHCSDAEIINGMAQGDIVVKNRIRLGNHAAMLLLRDQFLILMRGLQPGLALLDTEEKQIAYMRAQTPYMADPKFAMGAISLVGPIVRHPGVDQNDRWPLRDFYPDGWIAQAPLGMEVFYPDGRVDIKTEKDRKTVIERAMLEGFRVYREAVDAAIKKAEETKDEDIQGLVELTGNEFGAVVRDLVPRLMKREPSPAGGFTWVPDYPARTQVVGVYELWQAVDAQKKWKALDTMVCIAATSLIPMIAPAGILRLVAAAIFNLIVPVIDTFSNQVPEYLRFEEEYQFALGASKILGNERFNMASAQRTSVQAIVLNLISIGIGIKAEALEFSTYMSKAAALGKAAKVAESIQRDGFKALAAAAADDQGAFIACAQAVERKVARAGAGSLTETEKAISDSWQQVAKETKPSRKIVAVPEKEPLPPAGEAPAPNEASAPKAPTPKPGPAKEPLPPPRPAVDPRAKTPTTHGGSPEDIKQQNQIYVRQRLALAKERASKMAERELPVEMPKLGEKWKPPFAGEKRGRIYTIEEIILQGEGSAFMDVFRIKTLGKAEALKVLKRFDCIGFQEFQEMMDTLELLEKEGLAVVPVTKKFISADGAYMVQEFVERSLQPGREGFVLNEVLSTGGFHSGTPASLRSAIREALTDQICAFVERNMVHGDYKAANLAARRLAPGGKMEARILDPGSIAKWDKLTYIVERVRELMGKGFKATMPDGSIKRLVTFIDRPPADLREFWLATLERYGYLTWDKTAGKWTDGILKADEFLPRFEEAVKKLNQKPRISWRLPQLRFRMATSSAPQFAFCPNQFAFAA
jgi:hypothetical protein